MMMKKIILLFSVCLFCAHITAQKTALKTNLLYDATVTPNLGIEAGLAPRWTIDLSAGSPPFIFRENRKWKHWLVQDRARYCLCERFYRHFFDLHAGGGEFNISRISFPWPNIEKAYRYEEWGAKTGVSYEYSWIPGKRRNLEATIGLGIIPADYKRFDCPQCGEFKNTEKKTFFSPTRAGISLVYIINKVKEEEYSYG